MANAGRNGIESAPRMCASGEPGHRADIDETAPSASRGSHLVDVSGVSVGSRSSSGADGG